MILHVEPDLWGYIEQATARTTTRPRTPHPASSGDAALAGLPNTAAGFAQAIVRLRDQLAPNVLLAYHLSVWGTNWDIAYSNSPDAQVDSLAARAGAFYRSLGAAFDLTFTDIADRDASFKQIVYGEAARRAGTTPTSSGTRGSSRATSPTPAIASSSGRSRWATRRCAR